LICTSFIITKDLLNAEVLWINMLYLFLTQTTGFFAYYCQNNVRLKHQKRKPEVIFKIMTIYLLHSPGIIKKVIRMINIRSSFSFCWICVLIIFCILKALIKTHLSSPLARWFVSSQLQNGFWLLADVCQLISEIAMGTQNLLVFCVKCWSLCNLFAYTIWLERVKIYFELGLHSAVCLKLNNKPCSLIRQNVSRFLLHTLLKN